MAKPSVQLVDTSTNVQKNLRKELYPNLMRTARRVARRWNIPLRIIIGNGKWAQAPEEESPGVDVYVYAAPPKAEEGNFLPAPGIGMNAAPAYGVSIPGRMHQNVSGVTKSKNSNTLQYKPKENEIALYGKSVSNPLAVVRPPGNIYILLDLLQTFDGLDLVFEALLEEAMPLAVPGTPVIWSARSELSNDARRSEYEHLALGIVRRELQIRVKDERKATDSLAAKQRMLNQIAVDQQRLRYAQEAIRERVARDTSEAFLGQMFDDILAIPTIRGLRVEGSLAQPENAVIVVETEALEYEGVHKESGIRRNKLDIGRVKIQIQLGLDWNAKHRVTMTRPEYAGTHHPGHISFTESQNICFDGDVGNQLIALCADGDMLSLVHLLLSFIRFESSKEPKENTEKTKPHGTKYLRDAYYKTEEVRQQHRDRFIRLLGKHRQEVELASVESELKQLVADHEKYLQDWEKQRHQKKHEEAMVLGARAALHAAYAVVEDDYRALTELPEMDTLIRRGRSVIFRLVRSGTHAPPVMIWLNPHEKMWTVRGFRMLPTGEVCIGDVSLELPKPITAAVHRAFAAGRPALVIRILWAAYQNDMHDAQRLSGLIPEPDDSAQADGPKQLALPKAPLEQEEEE